MKSRNINSTRQKQSLTKYKTSQINYQSVRDSENNQKLSNLLNLSQFNLNLNNNDNNNSKISQCRKSLNMFKQNTNLHDINQYAAAQNIIETNSPPKKNIKTKRTKSTRKHLLSCHQILNIAKKRDTYSMLQINPKHNTTIIKTTTKIKNKNKKDITIYNKNHNNIMKIKNNNFCNNPHSKSLNQSKGLTQDQCNNLAINYPLSMSHSYIVFSEKDTTLNNTTNILQKMSKKLTKSNQSKYIDLQNKLQLIKIQHAAIIIQKNWRGYLTRKLLQDFINNQEIRLINIKMKKQQFQKFYKMSPGCNQLWEQDNDYNLESSSISQIVSNRKDNSAEIQHMESKLCSQEYRSKGIISSNNQNNKTLVQFQQQSSQFTQQEQDVYKKQSPIINGYLEQNQILQSVLQYESSQNITSRQQSYRNNKQQFQSNITQNQGNLKEIRTENSSRDFSKKSKFKIFQQFSQTLNKQNNKSIINLSMNNKNLDYYKIFKDFQTNLLQILNQKIQKQKKILVQEVKNSTVFFNKMLQKRQSFKKIIADFNNKITNFRQNIQTIFSSIPQKVQQGKLQNKIQFESPRNILKINRQTLKNCIKIQKQQKYNCSQKQSKESSQQRGQNNLFIGQYFENNNQCFQQEPNRNNSPISQYFTIELPTQELSPHKNKVSTGLDSLKTYFYNLHQQYLQQYQQTTQTSYLCKVLKKHSEIGPQNMIQRCLIQMLVEMLTSQYTFQDVMYSVKLLCGQIDLVEQIKENSSLSFVRKWADQLDKWELGPIQEVSGNMEESADVTQRNNTSKRKKKINDFKELYMED